MLRPRFQKWQMPDAVEGFVPDGRLPAVLRLVFLSFTSSSMTNCQSRVAICGSLAAR
jgi:hypothetical protein